LSTDEIIGSLISLACFNYNSKKSDLKYGKESFLATYLIDFLKLDYSEKKEIELALNNIQIEI